MAIIAGPDTDVYDSIQIIKIITSSNANSGAAAAVYNQEQAGNLAVNAGIAGMGAVTGVYDPELAAWFAGEIV